MFLAPKFLRTRQSLPDHSAYAAGDIHLPFNWVVADAAALAALTVTAADVYKAAWQVDTGQIKILTDDSPVTWATVSGGGSVNQNGFAAVPSASQAIAAGGSPTKVNYATQSWDTGGHYDPATSRFTATESCIWHFDASTNAAGGGQFNASGTIYLYKNGVAFRQTGQDGSTTFQMNIAADIELVATDYVEVFVHSVNAVTIAATADRAKYCWFNGHRVY